MSIDGSTIGIFVGIMGLVVGIVSYIKLKVKKRLSYEVKSRFSLLKIGNQIKHDVKVIYGQEEVKNIHLLLVKIINDGNKHILEEDFIEPITFKFNHQAKVLDTEIQDSDPKNIKMSFDSRTNNVVEIMPVLLNPGDWFVLKLLVSEYEDFELGARIIGVRKLTIYKYPRFYLGRFILSLFLSFIIFMFGGIAIIEKFPLTSTHFAIFVFGIAAIIFLINILYLRSYPGPY